MSRPRTAPATRLPALLPAVLVGLTLALALGAPARPAHAGVPEEAARRYQEAAQEFHRLRSSDATTAQEWREVAEAFRVVHGLVPASRRGIDALYSTALAYREAWRAGANGGDLTLALAHFRDFAGRYPKDRLADDALMHLATLLAEGAHDPDAARDAYARIVADYPNGDQRVAAGQHLASLDAPAGARPAAAREAAAAPQAGQAADGQTPAQAARTGRVRQVQHWSTQEGTRVILTVDPVVSYQVNRLAAHGDAPERVYFDLQRAAPGDGLAPTIAVGDAVLEQIRISRHDAETTRVVLDLKALGDLQVKDYRLPDARKIVVDLKPTAAAVAEARARVGAARAAAEPRVVQRVDFRKLPEPSVQVPVATRVHSIMIDPGHGGHDPGAVGWGVEEKSLVLEISKRLRDLILKRHPEMRVGLTRETDKFIPLHERPELAKAFGADLFVSVHLNANSIRRFHGVETYFLNMTDDRDALEVAQRENASDARPMDELNDILLDLLRDTTLVESGELAKAVQASLVTTLRTGHKPIRDLGVKQAPFLVLMGAEMPSVLVEAGFVTNRAENRRLQDPDYLDRIAEGIYDGLRRYIDQQNVISAARAAGPVAVNDRN